MTDLHDITKIDLAERFASFEEFWSPKIVAELNGQHVRLAKMRCAFTWHTHEDEDEMFLVVKGTFRLELRDRSVDVAEGQIVVVPRGVEHRPVADAEAHVMVFEPASTQNTGAERNEFTRAAEAAPMQSRI